VKVDHAGGQIAAEFVNARNEGFKMIAVLDPGILGDFLEALAAKPMRLVRKIV